ncbi:MAG: hypothetical protein JO061_08195 [Acidobacteriaceae bacterium]|nr:hypothetical protein [Acidobacteriaceae bacterium]
MRIKSYFASSVQSAIGLARKEFGDDVTLVTSHAASLEARHLGEYEVVFAIEEPAEVAKVIKATTQPAEFKQVFEETVSAPPPVTVDIPGKLDQIRSLLIEVGVDAPMVRALMTMIQRSTSSPSPVACEDDNEDAQPLEPETVPADDAAGEPSAETTAERDAAEAGKPQFTPAELAFFRSVAVGES